MSFPYSPNLQDVKKESLQTQLDHLNLLRLRHLQWMNSANDPRIEDLHLNIAEQIEQVIDQYSGLLGALQR
jgi:hypothetical protein